MPSSHHELQQRLLATFRIEAREHIDAIALDFVGLEKTSGAAAAGILDRAFRHAHSLKGAARIVNQTEIGTVCQALENVLAALKDRKIESSGNLFDLLHRTSDALGQLLDSGNGETSASTSPKPPVSGLTQLLQAAASGKTLPETAGKSSAETANVPSASEADRGLPDEKRGSSETIRVSTAKLDTVLFQVEELLLPKQAAMQRALQLRRLNEASSNWQKKWSRLRPDLRSIQKTLESPGPHRDAITLSSKMERLQEFLDWNQHFVETIQTELREITHAAESDRRMMTSMVDNLLDEMQKVVMQPFSNLLDIFPRFIREIAREQGKEVALAVSGSEIEIDRRILEEMKDPLVHLVRNSIDHGIETPAERQLKGKPPQGTITIGISAKNGSSVELLLSDDGVGIDTQKVKTAAAKLHLLSPEKEGSLNDAESLPFIFHSGVSTAPIVTDLSGRGIGLAIVKEKVEKLNGTLSVDSQRNRGTRFRIVLPLTLARFHGVTIRIGEHLFVLPTSHIERVMRVKKESIKTVENHETIPVTGQTISLIRLGKLLGVSARQDEAKREVVPVLILNSANHRLAFVVDEVLNEQEVLVKTLGRQLIRIPHIAGATVSPMGKAIAILSIPDLVKSALQFDGAASSPAAHSETPVETENKTILVAEDSITSRTLLKNILETAGYRVETAVDGIDAFTKLRSGHFHLIVSDVDMPRMNGFGLISKIRADKKFNALPTILITALDSREDREHGIDVGANAYIVKSSFDQGNLLEIIRRLL